jgi:hypothetical protein
MAHVRRVSLDIRCRTGFSTARFEADPQGLRLGDRTGVVELPWSAVRGVSVLPARRGRASVTLDLRDGSRLQPAALRSAEAAVAREVERLWEVYGPPAASAMWGRAPRSGRPVATG